MAEFKDRLYDNISLDLYNKKWGVISRTQRGNLGRGLDISLTLKGKSLSLSDDTECNFYLKKPDGHVIYTPCTVSNGHIRVALTQQMLAVEGFGEMEIEIVDTEGGIDVTTPIGFLEIRKSNVSEFADPSEDELPFLTEIQNKIKNLENQLADLTCEHIKITSYTVSPSTNELGSTKTVSINCKTDKEAAKIQVYSGSTVLQTVTDTNELTYSAADITATTAFKVVVTDSLGHETSQSKTVNFYNGVYVGNAGTGASISSLNKSLQSARSGTFVVTAGADEYIYYACPVRYGTPTFKVGGFEGGFELISSDNYTNSSGYTETYQLWKSVNANLGKITLAVT